MQNKIGILKMARLPLCMLLIAAILLLVERVGVRVKTVSAGTDYLPASFIAGKLENSDLEKECLLLRDSEDEYNAGYFKEIEYILQSMSVGTDTVDIRVSRIPDFGKYKTVVLTTPDFSALGNQLLSLFKWVNDGGRLFVAQPFEPTPITKSMFRQMGVAETNGVYSVINGLRIKTDFMIGSKGLVYNFDTGGEISVVNLRSDATIHVVSDTGIPVLWEEKSGKGRIVVNNLSAYGKSFRGYYAAAYSLLEDAFAYPVINSSVFFLDDSPAPVPNGTNEYISKYYKRDVESFFVDVWWPDMFDLAKRYGLVYTGVTVEDYTDEVNGSTERNNNVSKMINIGNQILNTGGELGYHGYNHQPLCYGNFNFLGKVDYSTWESVPASVASFGELVNFCKKYFPSNSFSVYVPPSNILSNEGRAMLTSNFPEIKTISGVYQLEDYEFEQEFDLSPDGIINFPRVISGTDITGYEKWTAFNELNFHYVNSHFMHPDDVLDVDRGADKGWAQMYKGLEDYVSWLSDVAPNLRNQTATEGSKAVQRYAAMSLERSLKNGALNLKIDNFYDGAYLLVRIRNGNPVAVSGGSLEQLSSELYVLTATSDTVEIKMGE